MSKIELRLSDIEPPNPEPPRTIYRDIESLPDPMLLGLTIRAYNYDDVALYFQITGSHPDYTFNTVNLGRVGSGANIKRNLDEFASRARPAVETEEVITLILRAYTDSGYTDLKHTYQRSVTVVIINSADGSWTIDEHDDFDDGTVQGWAVACEYNCASGYPTLTVVTDYVLSPPNSLRAANCSLSLTYAMGFRVYKSFTTPDRNTVYAILNIRLGRTATTTYINAVRTTRNTTVLVQIGNKWVSWTTRRSADYAPLNKWMRIVVPLPRNATVEISVRTQWTQDAIPQEGRLWLDDFKIISRD